MFDIAFLHAANRHAMLLVQQPMIPIQDQTRAIRYLPLFSVFSVRHFDACYPMCGRVACV